MAASQTRQKLAEAPAALDASAMRSICPVATATSSTWLILIGVLHVAVSVIAHAVTGQAGAVGVTNEAMFPKFCLVVL